MKISEAVSNIAYHYTSLNNALSILKSGKINLTASFHSEVETDTNNSGKFYFLSLTRSRQGKYHRNKSSGVLFTLDGRKLSNNFRAKAVDYWSNSQGGGIPVDEMEDRIFSDHSQIDIIKYISEISIMFEDDKGINGLVLRIYTLARRNKIPVYVYTDRNAWILNDKRKALTHDTITSLEMSSRRRDYNPRQSSRSASLDLIELFHKTSSEKLSTTAKELRTRMLRSQDFKSFISSTLHMETGQTSAGSSEGIRKLVALMKKHKISSFSEFLAQLKVIWKDIILDEEKARFVVDNKKQINAILTSITGNTPLELGEFTGENETAKAKAVWLVLFNIGRYDLYTDKLKNYEPNYDPSSPRFASLVDVMTVRLTGIET